MSKKKQGGGGIIFSTNPDFKFSSGEALNAETLPPDKQKLKVRLDTKQRAGKAVTLVEGFAGKEDDLEGLGKAVKTFCGTGGSVKDGQIIVQGDQRDKVVTFLLKNGYKNTRKI
jgi:translation initiation factor 1